MRRATARWILGPLCLACLLASAAGRCGETFKKSVVKVFTTAQNVDFFEPWKPGAQYQEQGCGTIVYGDRVLTTARLVNKGTYIEVQKFGETKRYVAKVEQAGFDLDLALLSLEDPDFFEGTRPVDFGDLPAQGDKLLIQGADEMSVKEDTVSTLAMVSSDEASRYVPAILTNSAIEPLNDGCPVFCNGKFVGLPFECSGKPDKTGSLIPVNVVIRFFHGIQGGRAYDGFPDLGFYTQDLENAALRGLFKITPKQSGEIITKIVYHGSADGVLKEGDVLTAIDSNPVDDEGYITLKRTGRIPEIYLGTFYLIGESISLDILRDGRAMSLRMPLKPLSRLVPYREDNRHPTYFMLDGLVFVPLTQNYFGTGKWEYFKPELQDLFFHGQLSDNLKQVVLISHVLPHAINKGYDNVNDLIVKKVNGREIAQMKDLLAAFDHPLGGVHVIEVDDHEWFGTTLVLDAAKSKQATAEIMDTFKITSDRSKDLK